MLNGFKKILHPVIFLLLALCSVPAVDGYAQPPAAQSLEQDASSSHFSPALMGSAFEIADIGRRCNFKSSEKFFGHALLPDRPFVVSTGAFILLPPDQLECFPSTIDPDSIVARAPPGFIA